MPADPTPTPSTNLNSTIPVKKKNQIFRLGIPLIAGLLVGLSTAVYMLVNQITKENTISIFPVEISVSDSIPANLQTNRNNSDVRQFRSPEMKMQFNFPSNWHDPRISQLDSRWEALLDMHLKISRGRVFSSQIQKEVTLQELLLEQHIPTIHLATPYKIGDWSGNKFMFLNDQGQIQIVMLLAYNLDSKDILRIEYPLPQTPEEELVIMTVINQLKIEP